MKIMKVILIKDCKPLGKKNAIIDVNHGYAMNYLIPQKFAIKYTEFSANKLQTEITQKQNQKSKQLEDEMAIKNILESKELLIELKSHNSKAIGGVNPSSLSKEITKQFQIEVNKAAFLNKASINTFGKFLRSVKLPHGTICNVQIQVVPQNNHE